MFVGRSGELAAVDALLAEAAGGYGGVLWLTGDPGIGKSAMLAAAVRRARRQGLQTASVRAVPLEEATPYALVDDLVRTCGGGTGAATSPHTDIGAAVALLVAALASWATGKSSLVVIDDVALAGESSVAAVVAALSRTSDLPMAVLVASRDALLPTAHLSAGGAAWHDWPQLRLGPLDPLASAAVARTVLGSDASERTVKSLVTGRYGNPGAIRDTAQALTHDQASGAAPLPNPLPLSPSMWRPWTAPLGDLPTATRDALAALAVAEPPRYDLFAAILVQTGCEESNFDEATDRGLIHRDANGVPVFVQPLLRAAIVAAMEPAACRALHRTAAFAAARLQLPTAVVVQHLTASTTRPDAAVASSLAHQAQRARDAGDVHGAADAQVRAARLTADPRLRRTRILLAVQDRADCLNSPEDVVDLLHLLGPDPVPSRLSAWVTGLKASVEPDLALAAAEQRLAIDQAREHAPELLAELLWQAADSAWAMGQPQAAMDAVNEFIRATNMGGKTWRELPTWTGIALRAAGLYQLGAVAESMRLRSQALDAADVLDAARCDPDTLIRAVELDDLLLADTSGARSRMSMALQRCAFDTPTKPCLWGMAAWQARSRGDWVSAQLLVHNGVAVCHELSAVVPLQGLLAVSVELASLQGDKERLVRHGRALRDLGIWTSDRRRLAVLDRATGLAELAAGSLDAAAASLAEAADVAFLGRGLRDAVIPSRVDLVEVLRHLDRFDEASARARALHPILAAMDQPLARAWDERVIALVSRGEDADAHYEAALVAHAADPDAFETGRTELLYGEHLRRTQRRSQARTHLSRAETLFSQMHAVPWLERARQELRVSGSPRRPDASHTPALTGQETSIATAVAQGRSTREVAELLVLSPRTVETHLSSVYRKLGVTGRTGLSKALAERQDEPSGEAPLC